MSVRSRLDGMLSGGEKSAPLIDIGATSLTGIRAGVIPGLPNDNPLAHPVLETILMEPADCIRLGSDFIGTGLLYAPKAEEQSFVDAFGVEWRRDGEHLTPVRHPLQTAGLKDIARHPRPSWQQPVRQIEPELFGHSIVIADAPCPGLLDMCFMLRNTWQFIEDMVENRHMVEALLQWSLETVISAYEYMLASLDKQPDIVVYSDDWGYQNGVFLSPLEFQNYILPPLRILIKRLRDLTPAAICLHSCGAIGPILPEIVDLKVEMVNLDTYARGMDVMPLRRELPGSMVLHGSNDLCALGESVANQDKAGIARLITELAQSAPVIAGPVDNMSSAKEVLAAVRGAVFIKNISHDGFEELRRFGPVRSIIENALENTLRWT